MNKRRLFLKQSSSIDCGPTCLLIVARYYGRIIQRNNLRRLIDLDYNGISIDKLEQAAEKVGFKSLVVRAPFDVLKRTTLPCIVHWKNSHYVVVYKIKRRIYISDPGIGLYKVSREQFMKDWTGNNGKEEGIALLLEPAAAFYDQDKEEHQQDTGVSLRFFMNYLRIHRKYFFQLFIGMFIASIIQLIFPVLTQSIVDRGILDQNLGLINLILIAQLMLFFSRNTIDFIRNWIFLFVSSRINIAIVSDFLNKLMRLKLSFFDRRIVGDLLQRIGDHTRVQSFISSSTLSAFFLIFNLVVYSVLIGLYSMRILGIFMLGNLLYFLWITLFLKKRKRIDNDLFKRNAQNQTLLIQLISGIRDIKLNNAEQEKRLEWETAQVKSYGINVRQMRLQQMQQTGAIFFDQTKNIFISYLTARLVIDGDITLGMMLSIQYMLGQLGAPINQFIGLFNAYQDAKISLERIGEIHAQEEEDSDGKMKVIPADLNIAFRQVSFKYPGTDTYALEDINLSIPQGKITAIVGMSGSGKTTLVKLLLQFYELRRGEITIGDTSFNNVDRRWWRDTCGYVLQDSFIFPDTILNNVTFGKEDFDQERFKTALEIANLRDFVRSLPDGFNTKLGANGEGLSQGQRQRLLLARAVYKSPGIIFLDEATNALDSKNESIIMTNLSRFFNNRTVIIVAHRLSTIMNADQIVVVSNGRIAEIGKHHELIDLKGQYYELVHNQLQMAR